MNVPENGGKDRICFVKYYARSRVYAHIYIYNKQTVKASGTLAETDMTAKSSEFTAATI